MGKRTNIHHGSDFTKFLRDEGVYEEVEAAAIKKVIAAALARQMERRGMTVSELAEKLGTSRAALNACSTRTTPRSRSPRFRAPPPRSAAG